MELAIPYQKLEMSKLHIIPQQNGYLPFEYKDGDLLLHRVVIITPILKVISFYEDKGKIEFECDPAFISKISSMQDVLKALLFQKQSLFSKENITQDAINRGFKMLTYNNRFVCYVPSFVRNNPSLSNKRWIDTSIIHVVSGDAEDHMAAKDIFIPGKEMRVGLKLSGIKMRGANYFIDHQIMHVWML
jgi:hypothetical protein